MDILVKLEVCSNIIISLIMDSIKLFFDIYAAANDCNKTKKRMLGLC
jgi:hypothetical protein